MKIAPNQRQELDALGATLKQLDRMADRTSRPAFQVLQERLDSWTAKVAVIGQVKAGKSTFVNALLHQHDFLPSDVNPWTSVVTNIRINVPGDPLSGARFEFFNESDWQEIVDGGSRIRALTEQLLPGFDTELLKRQSEELRDRAQKRLGKHYHTLLGSCHDYDFLSADLLKRYVCAGPGQDEGLERESLGRYAALTKVANAYMRVPGFEVPTIITDTPGVNDPFLVRDEFTCRSLDKSNVFIMVLSAHQPLTEVDIALIRILAEQDDKDVIVFVNRIDELDDYATEVPRVMEDVTVRLRAAIPDIDFAIVAGSAWMADLCLRDDQDAEDIRTALDSEELTAFLATQYHVVPNDRDERLMLASGMDRLRATLSQVIDEGNGGRFFRQMREDIRAEIGGAQFATRRERRALQRQVESLNVEIVNEAVADLETEIASIQDSRETLQTHIDNADTQIEKLVSKGWSRLETTLLGAIETFVDEQREVFEQRVFRDAVRGSGQKSVEIDMTVLQARLESEVRKGYDKSRAGIDVILNNCLTACSQTLQDSFNDSADTVSLDELPFDSFTSTLTLTKRTLNIDLITERGWSFWKRPEVNLDKSLEALRAIAAVEMRPTVEKILAAYNDAQVERATVAMDRLRVLLRMVDQGASERRIGLQKDRNEMLRLAQDPELRAQVVQRIQSQMELLERRLLNFSAIESAIGRELMVQAA
jgi:tRNA U34 5-carboxymethylaminomethyl modifying GTPase MnmE/TrmE